MDTRKLPERIVLPKLQSLILPVTRRVVLLVHCIVVLYPMSQFLHKIPKWSELLYIAKKHSAPKPDNTFKFKLCYQEFPGFYALRQHRNTQHGMQIGSGTKDHEHIVGDVGDQRLREELRSCQHFLVDSKLEKGETQSIQLRSGNSQRDNREREV